MGQPSFIWSAARIAAVIFLLFDQEKKKTSKAAILAALQIEIHRAVAVPPFGEGNPVTASCR
jgi:hypothetical protein